MLRRDFIKTGTAGALGVGMTGCSASRKFKIEQELAPISFEIKVPKPKGTMPMAEIGSTGIKVSKMGFGAHMGDVGPKYPKEREHIIHEAFDLGVNFFDVYENQIRQYEPMGQYLKPFIKDVVISICMDPHDGRTIEEELQRDLKVFGRDYIDLIRIHAWSPTHSEHGKRWGDWEKCFKFKEQGYVRAVGLPIHSWEDFGPVFEAYPVDFVLFPYNFYHNLAWAGHTPVSNYDSLPEKVRKKVSGVIIMKAFAGDYLVIPFREVADKIKKTPELNFAHAALRFVINSGINPDTTLVGMYNMNDVYENTFAYYNPQMSQEERDLLNELERIVQVQAYNWLPDHYKWLENWRPDSPDGRGDADSA